MLERFTNRALTALLLVSIALSLVGTLISVSRLNALGLSRIVITGGATANASVNLNVSQTIAVNLTVDQIDFGNGFVTDNSTFPCNVTGNGSFLPGSTSRVFCYCDMGTGNESAEQNASGTFSVPLNGNLTGFDKNTTDPTSGEILNASRGSCSDFLLNYTNANVKHIELENTGTITWLALNVYATDPNIWIKGGTLEFPDPMFQGGCKNNGFFRSANSSSVTPPYLINFNDANNGAPGATCATGVLADDTEDRVRFDVFVRVPADAPVGNQTLADVVFIVSG